MKISVVQTIQSLDETQLPADVNWGVDVSPIAAAAVVAGILCNAAESEESTLPLRMRYRTTSIHVTITDGPPA